MKRFRHTLQALLTVRERAEQTALEKYAAAMADRNRATDKVLALAGEQNRWRARWREEISRGCSAGAVEQWRASERSLLEHQQQARAGLKQAEMAVQQTFQNVLLARRDREAVEQHRQRQAVKYQYEIAREEQKRLDDLAQRRRSGTLAGFCSSFAHD